MCLIGGPIGSADPVAPDTTITAGPGGPPNDTPPAFSFESTDAGATFECAVDAGDYAPCASGDPTAPQDEGPHTFHVRAVDGTTSLADETPADQAFTVDTTAPDTTIDSGPSGLTNDSTPTFGFSSADGGTRFECKIEGIDADFSSCSTSNPGSVTTPDLPDGTYTIDVRAIDAAGNTDATPDSRTFTVDTATPETTIDSGPAEGSTT